MMILKHKNGSMNTNQIHEFMRPNCENRGLECASRLENVIIRTAFFCKITIGLSTITPNDY